jgi:hypothetical protein
MSAARYEGSCLCGQVRWRASAEPVNVRVCHCNNCRRATGAPFFARAVFLTADFEREGETTCWPTSPRVDRRSCARCGTAMFSVPNDPPARVGVAVATFADPKRVAPQMHIWVSKKLDWIVIDDGLPQHQQGA